MSGIDIDKEFSIFFNKPRILTVVLQEIRNFGKSRISNPNHNVEIKYLHTFFAHQTLHRANKIPSLIFQLPVHSAISCFLQIGH